jgi:hypothetical protein
MRKYLLSEITLVFAFLLLSQLCVNGQETEKTVFDSTFAAKLGADAYGNCAYTFVMLTSGDAVIADKKVRDSLFQGHMSNMVVMAEAGKLVLAGPFYTKNLDDFRGIFILNSTDTSEVRQLLSKDLAISNGLLKANLYPWYGSAALKELNAIHQKVQKLNF